MHLKIYQSKMLLFTGNGIEKLLFLKGEIEERKYFRRNTGMIAFVPCISPYGLIFESISS